MPISSEKKVNDIQIVQLICFRLGNEEYGFDILDTIKVIKPIDIIPIPQVPEYILGVINVRGDIIPLFDLRKRFTIDIFPMSNSTRFIVSQIEHSFIGIWADEIIGTLKIQKEEINPATSINSKISSNCIAGIVTLENRHIAVINLKELHRNIITELKQRVDN